MFRTWYMFLYLTVARSLGHVIANCKEACHSEACLKNKARKRGKYVRSRKTDVIRFRVLVRTEFDS